MNAQEGTPTNPELPLRTQEMIDQGQVWVWLRTHWEIRGTGLLMEPEISLVQGLRKVVKGDIEWIDANIIRLLLDRYDR